MNPPQDPPLRGASPLGRERPRTLATELVQSLAQRIRDGLLKPGDKLPTEAEIMGEFGVSRTVVREAISKLQAAGHVQTRHGIGSFVSPAGESGNFRIDPQQLSTVNDVVALLELRISLETESAGLAAARRSDDNLARMRAALDAFRRAIDDDSDAVASDFEFHHEVARATQNRHFAELMSYLGTMIIPRTRVNTARAADTDRRDYLLRVNGEHESIYNAIASQDPDGARAAMRTHLGNSRERLRRASPAGPTNTR